MRLRRTRCCALARLAAPVPSRGDLGTCGPTRAEARRGRSSRISQLREAAGSADCPGRAASDGRGDPGARDAPDAAALADARANANCSCHLLAPSKGLSHTALAAHTRYGLATPSFKFSRLKVLDEFRRSSHRVECGSAQKRRRCFVLNGMPLGLRSLICPRQSRSQSTVRRIVVSRHWSLSREVGLPGRADKGRPPPLRSGPRFAQRVLAFGCPSTDRRA